MTDLALIHGLNNSPVLWADLIAALPVDIVTHAPLTPALDTVEAIADELLAQLPPRFHLLGFSFGGYVAMAIVARAPERVQSLFMLGTSPAQDAPEQAALRAKTLARAAAGGYATIIEKQTPFVFHPDNLERADLLRLRAQMRDEYGAERFIAHLNATTARPDRRELFAQLPQAVSVAIGSHDRVISPAAQAALAATNPHAAFTVIEGSGHMVPLEQPAALAAAIERHLVLAAAFAP